jgi:hypothetical protein
MFLPFSLNFDADILPFLPCKGLATFQKLSISFNHLVTLVENFSTSKVKLGFRDF